MLATLLEENEEENDPIETEPERRGQNNPRGMSQKEKVTLTTGDFFLSFFFTITYAYFHVRD